MVKINEIGNKYNKLTVISENPIRKNGKVCWNCICDCGNEVVVSGVALRRGTVKSCGCAVIEAAKKVGLANKNHISEKIINEVGNRYGKLTVLEKAPSIKGHAAWKCQCDCGNIVIVRGTYLRTGDTQSCGCLKSSGELKIKNLLNENNIPYETEKEFDSCIFPSGKKARFDFYVDNKYLIEFDGIQHFKLTGWRTKEDFKKDQERDKIKTEWAKSNGIPLIRINYTQLDSLSLQDLLLKEG